VIDEPRGMLGLRTRWIERAVASNRILIYLAGIIMVLSVVAGVVVHAVNKEGFPTVGIGIWWAAVTFTTVGYGDVVPTDTLGRLVASVVMVFGITFISIITALVTSALVTSEQQRRREAEEAQHPPVHETLGSIERRLEAIERRLS
jgi:voltage-gated potassium channel